MTDQTTAYARAVVAGELVAGRLVKLACQRHLKDLQTGHERGLRFDVKAAKRAIDFFGFLKLGDGRPFQLMPFQQFKVGCIFGWKGSDGFRRFRTAYIEEGKGSGKTPVGAAILLYMLVADNEPEAECYCAAVTREQANIAFRDARNLAERSPTLMKILEIGQHNIAYHKKNSFLRPISSEHRGLDGKRVHAAVVDEIHEHPSAMVVEKIEANIKARRQPLILEITNAGVDRHSICWQHHEYSVKILEGRQDNDSWFAFICGLDPCEKHLKEGREFPEDACQECDQWTDEAVWPKANPGLDVILPRKYLRQQVENAKGMPAKEGIVKRLNFAIWTNQLIKWLSAELWAMGNHFTPWEQFKGKSCWAGLDLANRFDINALVLVFKEEGEGDGLTVEERLQQGKPKTNALYKLKSFFWMPREVVKEREEKDKVPYSMWEKQGYIKFTEGDVTDYPAIELFIQKLSSEVQLEEIAFDPYNCTQMAINLNNFGITMLEFAQNMPKYNEPTREWEALLRAGRLHHDNNPILNWMAGNVTIMSNASGYIRPVKPEHGANFKVDGIQAGVMGLARAMTGQASNWYSEGCLTQ